MTTRTPIPTAVAAALTLGIAALVAAALVVGPGGVDVADVVDTVGRRLAHGGAPTTLTGRAATVDALVWQLRLPRALLTVAVGGALGMAGALTQGLFRNPLAEPGVLGVSTGAAAFAVIGFVLGLDMLGLWAIPALAALGAATVLALLLAVSAAGLRSTTLLLSGVAVAAFGGAVITALVAANAERYELGIKIVHWLMGSFESRGFGHLAAGLGPLALGVGLAFAVRRDLDALHLGDETASSLGVDLRRTRWLTLAGVAVLVGMATAVAGVIGFVGLIVPHAVRLAVGPAHARLIPLSALCGALLLAAVDLTVRVLPGAPLPPGVVTSFLGAPFFIWLLARRDADGGASA